MQKNKGGKYMHTGKLTQGVLKVGDTVSASIDVKRRKAVMRAHSATHLLDAGSARCWATTSIRPAPWWSPTSCASTSPTSPP